VSYGNRKLKANSSNRADILEDPERLFLKALKHMRESFESRKFDVELLKAPKQRDFRFVLAGKSKNSPPNFDLRTHKNQRISFIFNYTLDKIL
jgi:hypothetical protein